MFVKIIVGGATTPGRTGEVRRSVGGLSKAVQRATRLGCRTPSSRALLATAQVIRGLRAGVVAGDWIAVQAALQQCHHIESSTEHGLVGGADLEVHSTRHVFCKPE